MADASESRPRPSQIVDGNAIVGALDAFGDADPSELIVECGSCHASGPLAGWVVEADESAYIVRCRQCTRTLWTILHEGDRVIVRVAGPCSVTTAVP
jgi:hypothetical protein